MRDDMIPSNSQQTVCRCYSMLNDIDIVTNINLLISNDILNTQTLFDLFCHTNGSAGVTPAENSSEQNNYKLSKIY